MKSILNKAYAVFLHCWFYFLLAVLTLLISPFLLITLIRKQDYPKFFWIARNVWASGILYGMGILPRIQRETTELQKGSHILVANHTSMLDIMLMYRSTQQPFVFIGKKELARYPLFGFFYKRVSILVDRKNLRSRQAAYQGANEYIQRGISICIFPEGGIPNNSDMVLDSFKDGAFRLSIENNLPVIPVVFLDNKHRLPYRFDKGKSGPTRALVLRSINPREIVLEQKKPHRVFKTIVRQSILNHLEKNQ